MIGGLVGGVLGLINFVILQSTAKKIELKASPDSDSLGAKLLRIASWADLIIFPVVGYFVGPMFGS